MVHARFGFAFDLARSTWSTIASGVVLYVSIISYGSSMLLCFSHGIAQCRSYALQT